LKKLKKNNKMKINRTCFTKKIVFSIGIAFCVSLSPFGVKKSHAWMSMQAASYKQMLETIQTQIEGVIMGMLKQEAAKMLNDQVSKLIGGGSSGSAMFITDWEDYLIKRPEGQTRIYMNDYLTQITSGRGSKTGYSGEGFSGGGDIGSYASMLVNMAKKETIEKQLPKMDYPGNPAQMFAQGNFKNMGTYLSGINNPWAFSVNAKSEYTENMTSKKKVAESRAVAYEGFRGAEVSGGKKGDVLITNPGSVIKEAITNVQDIGNKIVASATHPQEVISSIVSQMMSQAVQQGIGMAKSTIEKEVSKVSGQFGQITGQMTQKFGPGALYGNSSSGSSGSVSNRSGKFNLQEGAYKSYKVDSSGEIYRH
jgi:hypothetical protein